MRTYGARREVEAFPDFFVGQSLGHETADLHLLARHQSFGRLQLASTNYSAPVGQPRTRRVCEAGVSPATLHRGENYPARLGCRRREQTRQPTPEQAQHTEAAAPVGQTRWTAAHDEVDGVTRILLRRSYTGLDGMPVVLEERLFATFSAADPAWEARFIEAMSGARFRCAYLNAEESPGRGARRWRAGSPSGLPPAPPSPPPGGRSSPAGPTAARGRPSGAG